MDIINEIKNEIKNEINYGIDNLDLDLIIKLKEYIQQIKGNIFISGIGKCEIISIHMINLLKSISYKAFHISIQNSSHGDIGCMDENDICILFSKSGNTQELINFIKNIKLKNIKVITITCNENCKMKELSDFHITLPLNSELTIGIINIPNNSCLIMMTFINLLTKLLENIEIDKYKINHLSGNIGDDLKYIEDIMIKDYPLLIMNESIDIIDIVLEMTNKKIGFLIVNDKNNNIIGVISDGDIRRFIKNKKLEKIFIHDINKNFFNYTNKKRIFKDIKRTLLKYKFIPIIENKKCIGLLCENIIKNNYIL